MNESMLAAAFGIVAAIGWGISGFFDAKASRTVHPIVASFAVNGLLAALYVLIYFFFLHEGFMSDTPGTLYAAIGGAIIAIGAIAYFKALSIGPITLASPMSSAYPLVTTLVAVVIFGHALSPGQGVAILFIIGGILLVTEFFQTALQRRTVQKGPLLGLLTAVCWGIGYACVAQAVQSSGWQQATLVELIAMMVAFGVCIPFLKDRKELHTTTIIRALRTRNIIIASLVALVAALSFNIGFTYDAAGGAVVVALSAFYPVLTVILALRHFDEPVRKTQLAGVTASIIGVIGIVNL
ncbi:DMT family transporter [Streptomyces caniscabiei]|uniref:DMT family transporter n=1 Tax=Streptomyces caniscabiei TaxID=2746961 RepID=UPI0029B40C8E|nr:DMT family transporter [Streptomyces caniscabiei]MDX2776136.1 DMT family transporter [Streptomyces caniscabiei]